MRRYLVIMPLGIGDAMAIGSRAIERIVYHDPTALGHIDLLCSPLQVELFRYDPRIANITEVDPCLFPTPEPRSWVRGLWLSQQAGQLQRHIQQQRYTAIYPGMTTPIFYQRLHAPIMQLPFIQMLKNISAIRSGQTISIGTMTHQMIDVYFDRISPVPPQQATSRPCPALPYLYMHSHHLQEALSMLERIKAQLRMPTTGKLLVFAPDTSSEITRPPTQLLATSIADVFEKVTDTYAYILPSYTDTEASQRLYHRLSSYKERICLLPAYPRPSLLCLAALLEQADLFITGDTGMMHLAAATKLLVDRSAISPHRGVDVSRPCLETGDEGGIRPRPYGDGRCYGERGVPIIALFGGTNPGVHGYPERCIIVGNGRREQRALRPGIVKEGYNTRGGDMFDHISPPELTRTILAVL